MRPAARWINSFYKISIRRRYDVLHYFSSFWFEIRTRMCVCVEIVQSARNVYRMNKIN